ncbi:MAG: BON domain-containing protein [bacterium]
MKQRTLIVLLVCLFSAYSGCGWYQDYKLTKKVKDVLEHDPKTIPYLDNRKVTWNISNQVVKLRGAVCQNWEKDYFAETVKKIEGVKEVDDGIVVDNCQGSNPLFLNPFG